MRCSLCGRMVECNDVCSCCPQNRVLRAEPGNLRITANPVGVVVEGPPESPDGRVVDSKPASGGRSHSRVDRDGTFTVELSGQLDKGRANEARVLKVLLQAMRNRGLAAGPVVGAQDHRGEDALVELDSRRIAVQVVTVPIDPSLWKHLSSAGVATRSGTLEDAVQMIREALAHKAQTAKGTLLALDVSHISAIVGPRLVETYHAAYGDLNREFSFDSVWLVGPTVRSVYNLGWPGANAV